LDGFFFLQPFLHNRRYFPQGMSTPSFTNEEYIVAGEKRHQGICATDFLSTNNAVSFISTFFPFH
jgi:hypothetical protein